MQAQKYENARPVEKEQESQAGRSESRSPADVFGEDQSSTVPQQHRPAIAVDATPEREFVCALLWATPAQVKASADLLAPADLDYPHDTILEDVHTCAGREHSGPEAVRNELLRAGKFHGPCRREMETLPFAGGVPAGLHHYAEGILAQRFRERAAAYGRAITDAATTASEANMWGQVVAGGTELRRIADRLADLRGEAVA